ncbi:MAG TPA: hypothetical protein VGC13_31985 [Longimicrobium sp.]|jgi:hypothetical protein|uniref:hypothetical protein n=1 Tax=Longimicrobium sp. TaxID=2029185 RepID=UPI002ED88FDE
MKLVRHLLLAGLVAATPGCMGWRRASLPAPAPDAPVRLASTRVTHVDGYSVVLSSVVVTADSLAGFRAREPMAGRRLALHRSEVRHIQHEGFDLVRTALLFLGVGAAALLVEGAEAP